MELDDLTQYLAAQGIGSYGADLVFGTLRDQPDRVTCLRGYPGMAPTWTHNGNRPALEYPSMQAVTRATTFADAEQMARAVYDALHTVRNTEINGRAYLSVRARQTPFFLERDASNRVVFACNYGITMSR